MNNRLSQPEFPINHIANVAEVKSFAEYLASGLKVNFHPDDSFEDYVEYGTDKQSFNKEEIETGNKLMEECFAVCKRANVDIYDMMGVYIWRCIGTVA